MPYAYDKNRCPMYFERRIKGKRYVSSRWRCPRQKLKGLPYCSYCEPWSKKKERLDAKRLQRASVAQSVERLPEEQEAAGSTPARST